MKVYAVIDTNVLVSALLAKRPDSFLVTGNIKHFPAARRVVTPNELLEILNSLDNE